MYPDLRDKPKNYSNIVAWHNRVWCVRKLIQNMFPILLMAQLTPICLTATLAVVLF